MLESLVLLTVRALYVDINADLQTTQIHGKLSEETTKENKHLCQHYKKLNVLKRSDHYVIDV